MTKPTKDVLDLTIREVLTALLATDRPLALEPQIVPKLLYNKQDLLDMGFGRDEVYAAMRSHGNGKQKNARITWDNLIRFEKGLEPDYSKVLPFFSK